MKNEILKIPFNCCLPHINKSGKYVPTYGGGEMKIIYLPLYNWSLLTKMSLPCKEAYPFVQLFNAPYRVTKENVDWTLWNKCTHIDIDTKKYNGERTIDWNEFENLFYNFLNTTFTNNFYAIQRSYSGNSFHVIFYFNCEPTHDNFLKSTALSISNVRQAFIKLGYQDVLENNNEIIDGCSDTFAQGLYMSANNIIFSSFTSSENYGECSELKYMQVPDLSKKNDMIIQNEINATNYYFTSKDIKFQWFPNNISWSHHTRLALGGFLLKLGGNITNALELYELIIPYIIGIGNTHTAYELRSLMKNQIKDAAKWGISNSFLKICCKLYGVSFRYIENPNKKLLEIKKQNKENQILKYMDDLESIFTKIIT